MNRPWLLAILIATAVPSAGQAPPDNNAWKGRLYCLAAWAKNANPEEPGSLQEAFLDSTSLKPREIPGLNPLEFILDTESQEARRWFGQGLACLHLLWNEEAERAFRRVLDLDPECAMGYWGLAFVNVDRPARGAFFARMATAKLRPATPRNVRAWVAVLERFYQNPAGEPDARYRRLASDLEDLAIAAPGDVEAKAFFLRQLVLNNYRGGIDLGSRWAVDRIAAEIAAAAPSHPSSYQRLFLWMNRKPEYLLDQGLLDSGRLSPASAMPEWRFLSEAQRAVGQWEEGTASLLSALDSGLRQRAAWFDRPLLLPGFDESAEVLVQSLSRLGRVKDALALAHAMVAQPLPSGIADPKNPRGFEPTAYARGMRSYAQVCLEHGLHQRLRSFEADLPLQPVPPPAEQALRAEITALAGGGQPNLPAWLSPEARIAELVAAGMTAPAGELLNALPATHRRAFLPRALEILNHLQAGRTKEAMYGFDNAFRAAAGASDSPLCNSQGFVTLAKLRRVTGEWKLPVLPAAATIKASSAAVRNAYLHGLPLAPDFELPDGAGSNVRLAAYRGKPVLLIFFLGAGCLQCVEQLHAFLPLGPDFEKLGIPIVAVSSDPVEILEFTIREEQRGQKPIPFKIVSDSSLEAFRKFFVYNEFEKRPVHGTFLLDKDGKVRWWTTGNQPFMNPKWLLEESRRLLPPQ